MHLEGLDELDNQILTVIREDARLTYQEIGDRVGVSRVSVKKRMEAMQAKGIIRGYQTIIDPIRIPEGIQFFLDIEAVPDKYQEVVQELAGNRMIRKIYSVSGECRIHAIGLAANAGILNRYATYLYNIKGVRRIGCHTVLSTLMDLDGGVEYEPISEQEHMEK